MHLRFDGADEDMEGGEASTSTGNAPPPMISTPQVASNQFGGGPVRPALHATVQTSYDGDDQQCYVFDLAASASGDIIAASLSNHQIKLYKKRNDGKIEYERDLLGHSGQISGIGFPLADTPHALYSSSADGTVRGWDTRTGGQVEEYRAGPGKELWSFSVGGGSAGHLLAAGGEDKVYLWDRRSGKRAATFEEAHMQEVTQVHFPPGRPDRLVTASVDGLVCVFDTTGDLNEDDCMEGVLSVGSSVSRVGFFGPPGTQDHLWCLTHTEDLSLWNWSTGESLGSTPPATTRDAVTAACAGTAMEITYLIRCDYSAASNQLFLLAGTAEGSVAVVPVAAPANRGPLCFAPVIACMQGGHQDTCRQVLWEPDAKPGGMSLVTAGEDARICLWSTDPVVSPPPGGAFSSACVQSAPPPVRQRFSPY